MRRHPALSLRTSESASLQSAVGFNRPQADRVFDKLEEMQRKHSLPSGRIFNAEETGISAVHENVLRVLSGKGK
jgi:hypothetical protein